MPASLEISLGRLERFECQAIVNAANSALLPGGGVDGAIRAAAGNDLDQLLATAGPLAEGAALVTPGFKTPARWIIHTVAPHWRSTASRSAKENRLRQCYLSCLESAADLAIREIAFPALGTGAFQWPKDLAATLAVESVREGLQRFAGITRVVFCCFTPDDATHYVAAMKPN